MATDTTSGSEATAATAPVATSLADETKFQQPWLTYGLLALLAAVYACEVRFGVNNITRFSPSIETLIALGGINRAVIETKHEWYRFFTGPLLHSGPMHILLNGVALFFAGMALEKLVGRAWYLVFFTFGALGGAAMSFIANPTDVTSVGASGAIMALFAALFACSFHLQQGPRRRRIQVESIRILVPSLLPLANLGAEHIDIGAHVGGAITGGILAYLLLKMWPEQDHRPPFEGFATLLCMLAMIGFVFGISAVYFNYPSYVKKLSYLIPENQIPETKDAIHSRSAELVRLYPKDPRAHVFRAEALVGDRDLINARFELEAALKASEDYRFMYGLRLSNAIRVMLAGIWIDNGAQVEARKVVKPVCFAAPMDRPDDKVLTFITKYHLCE